MGLEKQRFVVDTSTFTGPGESAEEIEQNIKELIELISRAKKANITCYTPPSVWEETERMLRNKEITNEEINKLNSWLIQKSPSKAELKVPAEFIYQYVLEVRENINKGLREAEKAVMKTEEGPEPVEEIISNLRDRYRKALRKGIIDSTEYLSVLLLAKELGGGIVAKDKGIEDWSKEWGVRYIDAEAFPNLIREHLKKIED